MEIAVNYEYREDEIRALFDIEELVMLILEREGCPADTEVSLSFVDDAAIHELNRDFRDMDRPTDVLSFECDGVEDDFGEPAFDGASFELGDVVVAPDVAERQAPSYGLSFAEELSLLITHGLLHLCGYDHMEPDEADEMEARETELLSEFWKRPFKRTAFGT